MSHDLYLQALSAMFLFWNGARVLTYLPTIGKLLAKGADVRSHSLLSWTSWALSNGTFALMLLEMTRGVPNQMFWMNLANTLMCVVVTVILVHRRFWGLRARAGKGIAELDASAGVRSVEAASVSAFASASQHWPSPRITRWVVSSGGALSLALFGVAAYAVWSHVDPRGYEARVAPVNPPLAAAVSPVSGAQAAMPATVSAAVPAPPPPVAARVATEAKPNRAAVASARPAARRGAVLTGSATSQPGAGGSARAFKLADQHHRRMPQRGKQERSLLAQIDGFFHDLGDHVRSGRVQRDENSRP
jgi:hypothetical protein